MKLLAILLILCGASCIAFTLIFRHKNQIGIETKINYKLELPSNVEISRPFAIVIENESHLEEITARYGIRPNQLPELEKFWNRDDCSILLTGGGYFENVSYGWPQSDYAYVKLIGNSRVGLCFYVISPKISKKTKSI